MRHEKTNGEVSEQVRHNPSSKSTDGKKLEFSDLGRSGIVTVLSVLQKQRRWSASRSLRS